MLNFKSFKFDTSRMLNPLLFLTLTGLVAWLLLAAAYSVRGEFRLGVGELGDQPFVQGFLNDEIGQNPARVRWTGSARQPSDNTAHGVVTLPLSLNPDTPATVRVTFRGAQNQTPPTLQIFVNGVKAGESRADPGAFKTAEFALPRGVFPSGDTTVVEIQTPVFKPEGDSRYLGVQVSNVTLETGPFFRRPPLEALLAGWLYAVGLGLLLMKVAGAERVIWAALAGCAALIPWLLLPSLTPSFLNLWYTPFYLAGLGGLAALAALAAWRKTVGNALATFLERLETSPRLARNILLAGILLYCLYALFIIVQMDYIGHADYADNAVAARNIVQGKGYSLDYAAQFYEKYTLPRPADTWPPLQPFLIVLFYLIFGPTVWAAKLPNLLAAAALAYAIFHYGSRLFNRRAGLAAGLLSLIAVVPAFSSSPAFFESIAYPINDLPFTLLAFLNFGFWLLDFKLKKPEGSRQRAEGSRQRAEGRGQRADDSEAVPPVAFEEVVEPGLAIPATHSDTVTTGTISTPTPGQVLTPMARDSVAEPQNDKHKTAPAPKKGRLAPPLVARLTGPVSPLVAPLLVALRGRGRGQVVIAGLLAGLLFLSKPSGGVVLVGLGLWLLWRKYLAAEKIWLPWRTIFGWAAMTLLTISPFIIRNLLQFKTLYHSTETWDAWITKWNPPDENIYNLFPPFSNTPLPGPVKLLEYGWDNNLNAIANQFRRFFGHLLDGQLLPPLLIGLALLGGLALTRRPGRLLGLLGASFLIYWLAFSVLWHYEPRYYLFWLPWAYLLGLYGLSWLYDKISANNPVEPGENRRRVAVWPVIIVVVLLAAPGLQALADDGPLYTRPTGIVLAADWLKENTPSDAVVMSRNVWELSFHSQRLGVMTPNNATLDQVKEVMRAYGVRYLQLDHLNADDRVINRQWGQRQAFWNLLDRNKANDANFKLVYDRNDFLIYEWNGK
jgi:hypothetical protein